MSFEKVKDIVSIFFTNIPTCTWLLQSEAAFRRIWTTDKACNFIKKEALAQEFSCEFWEIFKNNFSYRAPPVAASANTNHHFITQLTFPNFAWYWFTQPVKHRFIICWEIHLFILQSLKGVWSRILPKTLSLKRKSVLCLCKFCLYQYYLHPIILQTWQKKYISDNFEATRHF